jgi:hypothetical protein
VKEAENYFKSFFNNNESVYITEQVEVAGIFTRWISEEEEREIYMSVTIQELKMILSQFKRDKSPSPDGWTVEFFSHFF